MTISNEALGLWDTAAQVLLDPEAALGWLGDDAVQNMDFLVTIIFLSVLWLWI